MISVHSMGAQLARMSRDLSMRRLLDNSVTPGCILPDKGAKRMVESDPLLSIKSPPISVSQHT